MNHKIMVNSKIARFLNLCTKTEKSNFTKALDTMESMGQLGEPLFRELSIWKYRTENLRIIYKKLPEEIHILKVLKGSDPTIF